MIIMSSYSTEDPTYRLYFWRGGDPRASTIILSPVIILSHGDHFIIWWSSNHTISSWGRKDSVFKSEFRTLLWPLDMWARWRPFNGVEWSTAGLPTTFLAIVNTSLLHLPEALFKQSSICDILRVTFRGPLPLFVRMSNRVVLIQKNLKFPILHVPKLFPLLHRFSELFCFRSTTLPSHVGTFYHYFTM